MTKVAEAADLQQQLYRKQNPDGGWGFHGENSWTEPTALALLALRTQQTGEEAVLSRGYHWLAGSQRHDGGWAPQPDVHVTTWVTSLAALALQQGERPAGLPATFGWLRRQVKAPETPGQRLWKRLLSGSIPADVGAGSSWFPGTAAGYTQQLWLP